MQSHIADSAIAKHSCVRWQGNYCSDNPDYHLPVLCYSLSVRGNILSAALQDSLSFVLDGVPTTSALHDSRAYMYLGTCLDHVPYKDRTEPAATFCLS